MKTFIFLFIAFAFPNSYACTQSQMLEAVRKHVEANSDKGSKIVIKKVKNEYHYSTILLGKGFSSNTNGKVEVMKGSDGKCAVHPRSSQSQQQSIN